MRFSNLTMAMVTGLTLLSMGFAFQRGRSIFGEDDTPLVLPSDAAEKTEFWFARLRYPNFRGGSNLYQARGNWTVDYPKAERQFVQGVRRLTRVHTRSVESVVDLESDEIYNHPWVYAVEPGHWDLPENQTKRLRDYLLRGGFLMVDDFHGTFEWDIFTASLSRVFPDRTVVDIENRDAIFHTIYDLDERFQVPGAIMFYTGRTYEYDGYEAKWRAVYDDKGRIMVAICHNMDLGDAWEWADRPQYPERYTSFAYRVGINYIIYAMSH
ncbi:MAG TPA: DUF4159 domain-containing protein [Bryobacteraceae bacterium]|nr:DUF4159 domain-containing protein [Bryobacteraceae bacterium]